jgi:hypothetical protein
MPALAVMDELGAVSEGSLASTTAAPDPTGGQGVLGDFRIVREVGRGGMGVVYEAVQISLGRRVALKVLPFATALDPQHLARFRVEAQAAALLHHPHIVPVHAVGCDRGVHYYAMQFIDGRTLAELIAELRESFNPTGDAQHTIAPTPTRRRQLARSAALLCLEAAEALEHAHSLGVIHRDVKPANLLIDATGRLWVADFGLARLGDGACATRSDNLVGTLRYMAPELALGRRAIADGRADLYALGATLYELLTLRPAFAGKDRRVMLRQIAFEEPIAPRCLDPAIPRDLETIVLKAMTKEPESRYATAKHLADDLRQFLDDRPIRARRPSVLGVLSRYAKRHRAAVATGVVCVLVASAVATLMLWRETVRTRTALAEAEAARARERDALRLTFAGSDVIASRALLKIASSGALDGPDAEFCRRALQQYEQISARHANETSMRPLVAAAEHRIGFLRRILGMPGAEAHLVRAVGLYEAEIKNKPLEKEARTSLAAALDDLTSVVSLARGRATADATRRRAIAVRRELVAQFPEVPEYRLSVALSLAYAIAPRLDEGKKDEADTIWSELAASTDAALGLAPGDAAHRNELSWLIASRPGGPPHAYHRAVELARQGVTIAPGDRRIWNTLGVAAYRALDDRDGAAALERSMALQNGGDPYDWLFLAMIKERLGEHLVARELYQRSNAWIEAKHPQDSELVRFRSEAAAVLHD